jgi:hypothetical protein
MFRFQQCSSSCERRNTHLLEKLTPVLRDKLFHDFFALLCELLTSLLSGLSGRMKSTTGLRFGLPGRVSPFPVARIFAATKKKVNSFFSRGMESRLAIRFAPD